MKKYIYFLLSVFIFLGCTKKNEYYYYEFAKKELNNNNIPVAIENFNKAINISPRSAVASKALLNLAMIYSNIDAKDVPIRSSTEKALFYCNKIIVDYYTSQEVPSALFISANLKIDRLKDYRSATLDLNKLVQNYPKNKYFSSAKFMLQNMGKDPEEILRNLK